MKRRYFIVELIIKNSAHTFSWLVYVSVCLVASFTLPNFAMLMLLKKDIMAASKCLNYVVTFDLWAVLSSICKDMMLTIQTNPWVWEDILVFWNGKSFRSPRVDAANELFSLSRGVVLDRFQLHLAKYLEVATYFQWDVLSKRRDYSYNDTMTLSAALVPGKCKPRFKLCWNTTRGSLRDIVVGFTNTHCVYEVWNSI